jgi:Ca-activated chloride channel family protein
MFFQNYGVNPFIETSEDHLSTFALDVDTASYALARKYVQDGNLPPADAIRVEEFVNYFKQDYALPNGTAFGLYADGAPSPFHTDGTYILRVGVQGYSVPEWQRQPARLTFVIDVSGSMSQDGRLELVKQALPLLVDRLRPDDAVAIVAYSENAWVVLNPTVGSDRHSILSAVSSLYPQASTNAEAGLRLGYQLAEQMRQPGVVNRVILLSDGVANVGATGPDAILESIGWYAKEYGITLTSVGVGMGNFNDVLLEQLADKGDGHYVYVDDLEEARKLFVADIVSTLQVIALDAKVQVDFNQDVVARYRLIGYENRAVADSDFRNDAVDAGEIGAGHTVTALYAVHFRPNANGRIATVQMRWKDPQSYAVAEINGNINTWDIALSFEQASPRYQLAVTVAQYAELLRRSPWANSSSLGQVNGYAWQLTGQLGEDPDVAEFARLTQRAMELGW